MMRRTCYADISECNQQLCAAGCFPLITMFTGFAKTAKPEFMRD